MTDEVQAPQKVEFSHTSLLLFSELLSQVQIPATHPQLEQVAAQVGLARRELAEALTEAPTVEPEASP